MLKFVIILMLMVFSVLYGIQHATKGIENTRGYSPFSPSEETELVDELAEEVIAMSSNSANFTETAEEQHEIDERKDKISSSVLSKIGKACAHYLTVSSNYLLNKIDQLLKKLIM